MLHRLHIENLICEGPCTVQDVDLMVWMSTAATTTGNFTIQTPVVIENVTVFSDLAVFGTVNGIKFDRGSLFLKHDRQHIASDVLIRSKFAPQNRIIPVYFENLAVGQINGQNVDDVVLNGVIRGQRVNANGKLTFTKPLKVTNLFTQGNLVYGADIQGKLEQLENVGNVQSLDVQFRELKEISAMLQSHRKGSYLSEIRLRSGIQGDFISFVPIQFPDQTPRLAVFDQNPTQFVQFYKFSETDDEFVIDDEVPPLKTQSMNISSIQKVNLLEADNLILEGETFEGERRGFKQYCMQYVDERVIKHWVLNSSHSRKFESIHLKSNVELLDCFVQFSEMVESAEIYCIGAHGPFLYQILEGAPISQVIFSAMSKALEFFFPRFFKELKNF